MNAFKLLRAVSILFATLLSSAVLADEPPAKDAQSSKVQPQKSKLRFSISKETTYLTEPLRKDGRVDYVAALNEMCSKGVTPENNAVVPLLQAIGPEICGGDYSDQKFRMLGIEPLPKKGDYLVPYEKFHPDTDVQAGEKAEETAFKDPAEQQKELDRFYETVDAPWTAAKHPRYAAWLAANHKPLEIIHEASLRPRYYEPMTSGMEDSAPVISILLEVAQESRSAARLLMAHAMYSIGEGNMNDACRDALACHRLARLEGQGPTLIEALVAIAIDGMANRGDVAIAQCGKLTPKQTAAFQEELRKLPALPVMADKLDVAERFLYLDCVAMLSRGGFNSFASVVEGMQHNKTNPLQKFLASYLPSAIDWNIVLRMGNDCYDRMAEASRGPTYRQRAEAWKKIDEENQQRSSDAKSLGSVKESLLAGEPVRAILGKKMGDILLGLLTPALDAANNAAERGHLYEDLSQISLALGAYRYDHGKYPERLANLAPKYLAELPKDRFSAADLIYRREGSGYLFYSVGYNGKDDGGKSHYNDPPDEAGDDFVIRTPKEAK